MLAVAVQGKTGDAVRNGSLLWQTDDLVDEPTRYAVTVRQTGGQFGGTITLRRLQRFQVQAGKAYAWKLEPLEANQRGGDRAPQPRHGTVTVDDSGLLTIRDGAIQPGTYRLTVLPR